MRYRDKDYHCTMEIAVELVGGKWKLPLLWQLRQNGSLRFNELCRLFPDATRKMLTQQLRSLEDDGLVHRKIWPQVPPRTDYSLTPLGLSLEPVLIHLKAWAETNLDIPGCADKS